VNVNKVLRLLSWGLAGFAAWAVLNVLVFEPLNRDERRVARHQRALENPEGYEMKRAWVRQEVLKDLDRDREREMRRLEERR